MLDNRRNILQCALQLFSLRGYDSVGVQEIVDSAGITKPTLYHYFGSKRGLLDSVLKENFLVLLNQIRQTSNYQGDLPHSLNKVVIDYFNFAKEHRIFYRLQLALWFAPPESDAFQAVNAFSNEQHQLMEKLFLLASHDHGNMKGRHKAYAATFLGMINTYIGLYLNDFVEINDELVYRAVHQFMHGIYS